MEKIWEVCEQSRHVSVQPADQGEGDEKARLLGVSNLFKFEISAKSSPALDRCSPKEERGRRELKGNQERDWSWEHSGKGRDPDKEGSWR